jgi:hypothetical protein
MAVVKLVREWSPSAQRFIECEELVDEAAPKRTKFVPQFVKLPRLWIDALEQTTRVATWRLAVAILLKSFERKNSGDEIVLSTATTNMPRQSRVEATREQKNFGLITIEPGSNGQALRVRLTEASLRALDANRP